MPPKKNRNRCNKKKITINNADEVTNEKGNWEFSFFQKKYDPVNEINIKTKLVPSNNFSLKNLDKYSSNYTSKEKELLIKQQTEPLNSKELIILKNYINKQNLSIQKDYAYINSIGISYVPVTIEGKIKLTLVLLENQLKKQNSNLLVQLYYKLLDNYDGLTDSLKKEYSIQLNKLYSYINTLDIIKIQFNELHTQLPPLNFNGFKKFDDWQLEVINNIDNNISTLINAPTSSGKSVLAAYTALKGRVLYVVPTDALAWQISAYIGHTIDHDVPIITSTYISCPKRDKFVEILNNSKSIIGTPDSIVDFLPFIKNNFNWIVLDEVHMIGNIEGSAMEYIIKVFNNTPFIGLSATISNNDEITKWFSKITNKEVKSIVCKKRFFNLQRYMYNNNEIIPIRPFSLINEDTIKNKSLCPLILQPTPPDIWELVKKLENKFELKKLDVYNYFSKSDRIKLDDVNKYFELLVDFVYEKYNTNKNDILEILKTYSIEKSNEKSNNSDKKVNLVDLTFKLKENKNLPIILFNIDNNQCVQYIREYAKKINRLELEKYPNLYNDRFKTLKQNNKLEKKIHNGHEDNNKDMEKTKKISKEFLSNEIDKNSKLQNLEEIYLQEPHSDFILTDAQYFHEDVIKEWAEKLKKYFPYTDNEYHYLIKLLWRGVGVYISDLPMEYLRLVQSLASQKQLGVVFSDKSLIYGVSMPFKSVGIIYTDNITDIIFQQMCGRAGRRGLDKEGNIIFIDFEWGKIKSFSTNTPPKISSMDNIIYSLEHANKISILNSTDQRWDNVLNNKLSKNNELYTSKNLYTKSINNIPEDINHLHMNWKLRHSKDSIIISFLIPYLKSAFDSSDHTQEINQINIAHFLAYFIDTISTTDTNKLLIKPLILNNKPYNEIIPKLKEMDISIDENIDNSIFNSIRLNKINIDADNDETIKENLLNFGIKIKSLQHYCYHSKINNLCKLLGKLLTRIMWIYYSNSLIVQQL